MNNDPDAEKEWEDHSQALASLRSTALTRLFPGSVSGIKDASQELLPRIVGMEIAYRSRLLEELQTVQLLLLTEMLRPLKDRAPSSLAALAGQVRGIIKDQLQLVREAPIGTGADAAKHQAADLLARRAYVMAEIRRRGLEHLLGSAERQPRGEAVAQAEARTPELREIVALAGALTATEALTSGDADTDAGAGAAVEGPAPVDAGALAQAHAAARGGAGRVS
jgi:hypothetical protein